MGEVGIAGGADEIGIAAEVGRARCGAKERLRRDFMGGPGGEVKGRVKAEEEGRASGELLVGEGAGREAEAVGLAEGRLKCEEENAK